MATFTQSSTTDYLPVAEFFHDRSVFVTGGTGFMGKVLVEKLLRSCPGIKNIYLLMRPKRGQDVNARLAELTDSPVSEWKADFLVSKRVATTPRFNKSVFKLSCPIEQIPNVFTVFVALLKRKIFNDDDLIFARPATECQSFPLTCKR